MMSHRSETTQYIDTAQQLLKPLPCAQRMTEERPSNDDSVQQAESTATSRAERAGFGLLQVHISCSVLDQYILLAPQHPVSDRAPPMTLLALPWQP